MRHTIFLLITALAATATATISLNISGPDWDYTTTNLKSTTSPACKEAYSAPIDCPDTLLGLVASMRPAFKPSSSDYAATCTPRCSAALATYVQRVAAACALPNDAARDLVHASKPYAYADRPVELVGQLMQYVLASDCRTASNGTYCALSRSAFADTDFDCNDACYASFYQLAHDHPTSHWWFNYYELLPRGDYWDNTFAAGYKHLQQCGKATSPAQGQVAAALAAAAGAGGDGEGSRARAEGVLGAALNQLAGSLP